jgi:type II secretory pathway component PulC
MFFNMTFHFDNKATKNRFINIMLSSSKIELRFSIAGIYITSNNTHSLAFLANGSELK